MSGRCRSLAVLWYLVPGRGPLLPIPGNLRGIPRPLPLPLPPLPRRPGPPRSRKSGESTIGAFREPRAPLDASTDLARRFLFFLAEPSTDHAPPSSSSDWFSSCSVTSSTVSSDM